jgi:hypothetical protein
MVEFVVALVCILVLVAGIIQISVLGLRHSTLMNEARSDAGRKAMIDVSSFAGPLYVSECTVGGDGIAFSKDDDKTVGDPLDVSVGLASHANPDDLDGVLPGNMVTTLAESEFPHLLFGLVEGEKTDSVELIPIMREMVYRKDAVDLKVSAWMTWTRGIY